VILFPAQEETCSIELVFVSTTLGLLLMASHMRSCLDRQKMTFKYIRCPILLGADCGTVHYLVVAKLRERISVSKRKRQKFNLERFDLKKLGDVEVKDKYQVEISNRFSNLESLDKIFHINDAWESIRENIKTSANDNRGYDGIKHNKPWFDDGCSKLIDQRKKLN
jgi:hypothetical protein